MTDEVMKKGVVIICCLFLCLSIVSANSISIINEMFCGKGGLVSSSVKCDSLNIQISPFECLNLSKYVGLKKWEELGEIGYAETYFEYKDGERVSKEEFCRKVNTNYCFYNCVDETKTTAETGRFFDSYESEISISERQFRSEEIFCGNNVCEGDFENGFFCTERRDIHKNGQIYNTKLCLPVCYQDCGYIIKNSGIEAPQELIQIPFADMNGARITPLFFEELGCLDSGFCLEDINDNGAEISYKGNRLFLSYYNSYNYEVDVLEGEDKYLYLTYNYLFEIKKPGNPIILFFKNFII